MGPAAQASNRRNDSRVSTVVGLEDGEQARSTIMRKSILLAPIAALLCLPLGCGPADALKAQTGHRCVVHFRGDYLGMASAAPFPPGTDNFHGASVDMPGILKSVDADWLTLEVPGNSPTPTRDWVIPREAVLMVSFDRGAAVAGSP